MRSQFPHRPPARSRDRQGAVAWGNGNVLSPPAPAPWRSRLLTNRPPHLSERMLPPAADSGPVVQPHPPAGDALADLPDRHGRPPQQLPTVFRRHGEHQLEVLAVRQGVVERCPPGLGGPTPRVRMNRDRCPAPAATPTPLAAAKWPTSRSQAVADVEHRPQLDGRVQRLGFENPRRRASNVGRGGSRRAARSRTASRPAAPRPAAPARGRSARRTPSPPPPARRPNCSCRRRPAGSRTGRPPPAARNRLLRAISMPPGGSATATTAASGRPAIAAMSERLTAIALRPTARGPHSASRKSTPSVSRSVVTSNSPGGRARTAQSSPGPTRTRGSGGGAGDQVADEVELAGHGDSSQGLAARRRALPEPSAGDGTCRLGNVPSGASVARARLRQRPPPRG